MRILIVTNSCSENKYKFVCSKRKNAIIDPQQKFFRLFIEGLGEIPECDVEVLSALPVSASTVKKYVFKYDEETTNEGIKYQYLPFLNGKIMRYVSLIFAAIYYTQKWCSQWRGEETVIITDPLIPIISIPSKIIAKKYGIKTAAIVTDLPMLATDMKERKESWIKRRCLSFYQKISNLDLQSYDYYIPLTESINQEINKTKKPYCVIEGFADAKDMQISKVHENYAMYAGGIYEKYGVKALVEAFLNLKRKDIELYIFGEGTYVEELEKICLKNKSIKYMGCVSVDEAVRFEKKALLLINPRPTDEKFAKYSFPSKTMEYLLSGTAVVSTRLPGIPQEYFEHMYAFDGFTAEEMRIKLDEIFSKSNDVINAMGKNGHEFVLKEKNNLIMSKKIYQFLKSENDETRKSNFK